MLQHWQYNMIVTQNTGAIKYSVSDTVEEKGTIVKKEPPVNHPVVELGIIHEEFRSSTNKQSLWIYQYSIL